MSVVEAKVRERIVNLIAGGEQLRVGTEHGQARNSEHANRCVGWVAAAYHALALVSPNPSDPYHQMGKRVVDASERYGYCIPEAVGELVELFKRLLKDVDDGLVAAVADQARAETFDDLLDHAADYLRSNKQEGAGVLATVVFEDTIRRIATLRGVGEADTKLDELFTLLERAGVITGIGAKRCRAAAAVRNKALHAKWAEFSLTDVAPVIDLTRELIRVHLERR